MPGSTNKAKIQKNKLVDTHLKQNLVWSFSLILWEVFVGHPILAASYPIEYQWEKQALE